MRRPLTGRVSEAQLRRVPAIAVGVLLATVLVQRPLFAVEWGSTYLIRPWDIAWALFVVVTVPVLLVDGVDLRSWRQDLRTPLGLFSLFALLSVPSLAVTAATFGSSHFGDAAIRAGRFLGTAFVGFVLARYLLPTRRRALIVFVIGLSAVAGIWAFFAWIGVHTTVVLPTGPHELDISRAGGPFGNFFADPAGTGELADHWWAGLAAANDLGFWLAIAVGPACVLALLEWSGRRRPRPLALVGAAMVALVLGLAATHSREAWLAAFIGLGVSLWFQRARFQKRWTRVVVVTAPVLVVSLLLVVPSLRMRFFESFQPGTFSFETGPRARFDSWLDGLRWGWDRFPIGWGVGGIEEHSELFGHQSAENVFIQAWASMGVAGAALLIASCVVAVKTSAAALRRRPSNLAASFALSFFVVFVVHGMFGNTLTDPTIEILLGFALAVNLQLLRSEARWRGP